MILLRQSREQSEAPTEGLEDEALGPVGPCLKTSLATTCSNALDSMNTRLTTSSVGTGRLGVKWSRRQTRRLDEK
ncbi:hypothetical protein TNCV_1451421 [Trichonephila clavipes]|nr:hypothetical protein TNCV_1451421 [Trichonephila clavipes]